MKMKSIRFLKHLKQQFPSRFPFTLLDGPSTEVARRLARLCRDLDAVEQAVSGTATPQPDVVLTEFEQGLLQCLALVPTMSEIAELVDGYSARHLRRLVEELCAKCGVANHHQLIVWGAVRGYCQVVELPENWSKPDK